MFGGADWFAGIGWRRAAHGRVTMCVGCGLDLVVGIIRAARWKKCVPSSAAGL
jgi:hypothetical protein